MTISHDVQTSISFVLPRLCIVDHWSAKRNVLPKHGFYALQSLRVELSTGKQLDEEIQDDPGFF